MMRYKNLDVALAALMTALAVPCFAQTSASGGGAPSDKEEISEVVVTGTRLSGGFATPTPVTTVDIESLQRTAPTTIGEALAQLPALSTSVLNTSSGAGSAGISPNGQILMNLRGLGWNRTLVLLDGQRLGATNENNAVDLSIIPQNLIKRVDIVTGGATASYGSDAVAGVVNFILDTSFQGIKAELSGGMTSRNDIENGHLSVAFGTALGERGHLVGGVDLFKLNGLEYGNVGRDWFDHPYGAWPNPVKGAHPSTLVVPNTRSSYGSAGGTITSVQGCTTPSCLALVNQQFLAGGALGPFQLGQYVSTSFASGGDGAIVTNPFAPDLDRESVFLHGEYDLSSSLTLWAEGGYSRSYMSLIAQPPRQTVGDQFTIFPDNAFLPAEVAAVFTANPTMRSFKVSRFDLDWDRVHDTSLVKVFRVATGAKGSINERWSFDTTLSSQYTIDNLHIFDNIIRNTYAAVDAVRDPQGNIVCRSTQQGLDPGCAPLNIFGLNAISQAANDYVMGNNKGDTTFRLAAFDANLRGDLGDSITLGAGPIRVALGMAYRHESADRKVDAYSDIYNDATGIRGFPANLAGRYGGYQFYNPSPLHGSFGVTEGYVELGIPLLKDLPLVQALNTTVAGRLTDYSQSGVEPTWKLGLEWTTNDSLRIRGTVSRDSRAPTLLELFGTATVLIGSNIFPYADAPAQIKTTGQTVSVGNPNLTPEHATTYTGGIVLSPTFLPRLRASVDYYRISIKDAISDLGPQSIVNNCYAGDQKYCQLITVNRQPITTTTGVAETDSVVVTNPTLNLASESTSGLDIEAQYSHPLGAGTLSWRLLGNYLLTREIETACVGDASLVGAIGTCGLFPRITGRLSANYNVGPFGLYVQERYINGGKLNPNLVPGVDISFNNVPSIVYTDLNFEYNLDSWLGATGSVYLNVSNVFDKDPPTTTSRSRSWVEPSSLFLYDPLGRRYVVGIRLRW